MSAPDDGFPWLNRQVGWLTPRLPNEVFLQVVSYCDPATLATLGRCNKDVHSIAIPALYTSIDIAYLKLNKLVSTVGPSARFVFHEFDVPNKWASYKIACCALTKRVRLVGGYKNPPRYNPFNVRTSQTVLFANVDTLILDDSSQSENMLLDCHNMFRARHLCYKPFKNDEDQSQYSDMWGRRFKKLSKYNWIVALIVRHWPLESVTLHGNIEVPVNYPPGGVARVFVPHVPDGHCRLQNPYTMAYSVPLTLARSVEVISIKCPSPSEIKAQKDAWCEAFQVYSARIDDVTQTVPPGFLDHLSFISYKDAAPCALCGEK